MLGTPAHDQAVMAILNGGRLTNCVQKSTVSERHPGGTAGKPVTQLAGEGGMGLREEGEVWTSHALLGRTAEHSERSLGRLRKT